MKSVVNIKAFAHAESNIIHAAFITFSLALFKDTLHFSVSPFNAAQT